MNEELEREVKRLEKYNDTTILKLLREEDIKEIEKLNTDKEQLNSLVNSCQEEIRRLNKIIEIKNKRIQQLMKRTRSARIDKAIEYIENTCIGSILEVHSGYEEEYTKPLLDILKGSDKE